MQNLQFQLTTALHTGQAHVGATSWSRALMIVQSAAKFSSTRHLCSNTFENTALSSCTSVVLAQGNSIGRLDRGHASRNMKEAMYMTLSQLRKGQ
jgi:hypothetical protein